MKALNVMDLNFNLKAIINGYNSILVQRVWNGIGNIHIEINSEVLNADQITVDSLVWLSTDTNKVYIIERIEESFENGIILLKIDGLAIESLLQDYITVPPIGDAYDTVSATREYIVRTWVDNNAISAVGRNQYALQLDTYHSLGVSTRESTRYKNLAEECTRILAPESLSWKIDLDIYNQLLIFKVLQGVDRTYLSAGYSSKILFGKTYGNMSTYTRLTDNIAQKNYAYTAGRGEGELRTIVEVDGIGAGERRKEFFVDARDISETSDLQERASQNLVDLQSVDNFEFEVIERQYAYEIDYDLGDIVTIILNNTDFYDRQIIKITETYERNKITVDHEFGVTYQGLTDKVKRFVSGLRVVQTI